MKYVPLYSPASLADSVIVESRLKHSGIRYIMHGEYLTHMYPFLLPYQRTLQVHPEDYVAASDIILGSTSGQNYRNTINHHEQNRDHGTVNTIWLASDDRYSSTLLYLVILTIIAYIVYRLFSI